jgi:hypothetical protein
MRIIAKKKLNKKSKGYRLRNSTHKLIDKMQEMLQCSQDDIVTDACKMFYEDLKKNNNNNGIIKNAE